MIHMVFSSIAKRYPDKQAIIDKKGSITYKNLDFLSGCMAFRIEEMQKKSGIIAIYLSPSIDAIISMLGILKSGNAYLSLDVNDPISRTLKIIDHSNPNLIIASKLGTAEFEKAGVKGQFLDVQNFRRKNQNHIIQEEFSLDSISKSQDSDAYIIYTSGSTGSPKGIPIKHRSVINLLEDFSRRCPLGVEDRCSLWTNLNFDVSVYEIWSALLSGASLFIPDQRTRADTTRFIAWLKKNHITSAYIPPFMIAEIEENQQREPLAFNRILTGVEPILESLLCSIKKSTPNLCLINGYGPAEATICATLYEVPEHTENSGNAPIGKPVRNLEVYILNEKGEPVEDGEKGEIIIAGIQVAGKYLNDPILSAEKFFENPLSDSIPGKIYRTGDLGIRLKSGNIMFSGRKDFQIKLRGFRIETGEIENTIKEFSGINQAAVVLKENEARRKILTAYIDTFADRKQLVEFLKKRLPKYMVPSSIVTLEKIPQTSQGKIDKKSLTGRNDLKELNKEKPQTKEEKLIAEVWQDFFDIFPIYRNDDFLLLGGDSIIAVKIISRLNSIFSINLEISSLFDHSQLSDFTKLIKNSIGPTRPDTDVFPKKQLSNIQTRSAPILDYQYMIWLFEQINPGTSVYHIPLVYSITGEINCEILEKSLEAVQQRHIPLQSVFVAEQDRVIQRKHKAPVQIKIEHMDKIIEEQSPFDILPIDEVQRKWILEKTRKPFNLEKGPVFRTDILITGELTSIICFTFHHIIFDGWSVSIFIRELNSFYKLMLNKEPANEPTLHFSYYDYVSSQAAREENDWMSSKPFFIEYFKGLIPGKTRAEYSYKGERCPLKISENNLRELKKIALESKTTPFIVLLSLFQILLYVKNHEKDQTTAVAWAGRDSVEAESLIGFFMNTLICRNLINTEQSFTSFLHNVKTNFKKILGYKNISFNKVYELSRKKGLNDKIIKSLFLMQTMDSTDFNFPGIESKMVDVDMQKANADITLEFYEKENGLKGFFEYKTDVFKKNEIEGMIQNFNDIIANIIKNPEASIINIIRLNTFPISPMQHGMIIESLRAQEENGCYIQQIVLKIEQPVDLKKFKYTWKRIIKHHSTLRLGFKWKGLDYPQQFFISLEDFEIGFKNWKTLSENDKNKNLKSFLKEDRKLGFLLDTPPLMRVTLIQFDKDQYTCIWTFHHAIGDGRSVTLVLKDFFNVYHNYGAYLEPSGSFQDYILWLEQRDLKREKLFWINKLNNFTEPISLPFCRNKRHKEEISQRSARIKNELLQVNLAAPDTAQKLYKICQKNSVTLNSLLMGAWALLLSHYTGKDDIVFGATRNIRHWRKKASGDTGLYINTLPVRLEIDPEENLISFLHNVRKEWIETGEFVHTSLGDILTWSQIKAGMPLFDIYFAYDHESAESKLKDQKKFLAWSSISFFEKTPASLFLTILGREELVAGIKYDSEKFSSQSVQMILEHFKILLGSIAKRPDSKLNMLQILTAQEKRYIQDILNTKKSKIENNYNCFHYFFEHQVSLNKDAIALKGNNQELSYGELNIFANQIASYLLKNGAGPEIKIAVLLDQDIILIAVLLGILKSGAAYIPVDVLDPAPRIDFIIRDSNPEIIITSDNHRHRVEHQNAFIILLDKEKSDISAMGKDNPEINVTLENLAYIIYTSGSTGKPKGVMIEHGALIGFTQAACSIYDIRQKDKVLQFAAISFDASAEEIYPALFAGATLIMKPRTILQTPTVFIDFCKKNQLTVLDLPTSYWHLLVDEIDVLKIPERIRLIIIGGDEANPDKVRKWKRHVGSHVKLFNTYGPTETTVAVSWADLSTTKIEDRVSIGKPFPSMNFCILNQFSQPVPQGVPGELYIGGLQVARGYLNRRGLTEKAFVRLDKKNKKIRFFKTGDFVKIDPQGEMVFLGRVDRQIKIRGFRVEPGEIEKEASSHRAVIESAFILVKCPGSDSMAILFIVLKEEYEEGFQLSEYKRFLSEKLPSYMLPSVITILSSLPRTHSAKVDYNVLTAQSIEENIHRPRNNKNLFKDQFEKELKEIWIKVLNFENFGREDNFFSIGGSSLSAIKLVSMIEKQFKISIPVVTIFKFPTIKEFANQVKGWRHDHTTFDSHGIVTMKGEKAPIIMIGGTVDNAKAYINEDLKGHPFYHVYIFAHTHNIENNKIIPIDIHQIAKKCINEINQIFPAGPYIILAFCRNAIVAHEIACQLKQMDKETSLLVLMDEFWRKQGVISFVRHNVKGVLQFGLLYTLLKIKPKIKQTMRRLQHFIDGKKESFYITIGRTVPETVQYRLMENAFKRAFKSYEPNLYDGNILLLDSMGWMKRHSSKLRFYYEGNIQRIKSDVQHTSWFEPEQIKRIIKAIDDCCEYRCWTGL